jgi:putative ATPase
VPTPLQDAHDRKGLGHGQGYLYPHNYPGHWVEQEYLPADLTGSSFYEPGKEGDEPDLAARWPRRQQTVSETTKDKGKRGEGRDDQEKDKAG